MILQYVLDGLLSGGLLAATVAGAIAHEHLTPNARCAVCGTPHLWRRSGTCTTCHRPYPLPKAGESNGN